MIHSWLYKWPDLDIWFYLWPDVYSTITLTDLFIVHLCLICYFYFIPVYILSSGHTFMHVHLLLYSYTFIRISDSLDLHIQICGYFIADKVFGGSQASWGARVLLLDHLSRYFLSLLYSIAFMIHALDSCLFYSPIHMLSFVDVYMYYCSDIDLS